MQPSAFTAGHDRNEFDKRLVAELIGAGPMLFLDNLNARSLGSDTLESVLTERPARVRIMGVSEMVPLNSTAFIAITGNGLSVTEDLARRFVFVDLDPRCDDPESRPFKRGFLDEVERDRCELLAAALTIWRWGRQAEIAPGLPLGSFEKWSAWCRDPLVALGCPDPVQRMRDAKASDPRRRMLVDLFEAWWMDHAARATTAAMLSPKVLGLIDPQNRGRQFTAQRLQQIVGARAAGFVLTRQAPAGKWSAATFALQPTTPDQAEADTGHRTHRTHREAGQGAADPMTPMPDPSPTDDDARQLGN